MFAAFESSLLFWGSKVSYCCNDNSYNGFKLAINLIEGLYPIECSSYFIRAIE